jgi:hypothetical protein
MIYAIPTVQIPIPRQGETKDVVPYLNVSLAHYTSIMPPNPYQNLTLAHPYSMNFFRLLEAFHVFEPPHGKMVGLGAGLDVVRYLGKEGGHEGELLLSDASLRETLLFCRRLSKGSTVLIAVPDQTSLSDVQLTYLFAGCFATVQIMLPSMAHADADRIMYCTDFLGNVPKWLDGSPPYTFEMTNYFVTKLDEINSIFGQARFDQVKAGSRDHCAEWLKKFMKT